MTQLFDADVAPQDLPLDTLVHLKTEETWSFLRESLTIQLSYIVLWGRWRLWLHRPRRVHRCAGHRYYWHCGHERLVEGLLVLGCQKVLD